MTQPYQPQPGQFPQQGPQFQGQPAPQFQQGPQFPAQPQFQQFPQQQPPAAQPGFVPQQQAYAPPQQAPWAPQPGMGQPQQAWAPQPGYPPQQFPQQAWAPQQGFGVPAVPPPPAAKGAIADAYSQGSRTAGYGVNVKFPVTGTEFAGWIARDILDTDVTQETDPGTRVPKFQKDNVTPKWQMTLPFNLQPSPQYPEGKATVWAKTGLLQAVVRGLAAAGYDVNNNERPKAGDYFHIRRIADRPTNYGNAAHEFECTVTRGGEVALAPAAPAQPAPQQFQQAPAQPAPVMTAEMWAAVQAAQAQAASTVQQMQGMGYQGPAYQPPAQPQPPQQFAAPAALDPAQAYQMATGMPASAPQQFAQQAPPQQPQAAPVQPQGTSLTPFQQATVNKLTGQPNPPELLALLNEQELATLR